MLTLYLRHRSIWSNTLPSYLQRPLQFNNLNNKGTSGLPF
uniref:O-methyltransferase n=1 Tax=Rhizophora mucronata TaxID=61149 RepID=A0A2P2LGM1_RHIMU